MSDTIFALSSGPVPAGIAVVRVSGPAAEECLKLVTSQKVKPREAALRQLTDRDENIIDHAVTLWFPGPKSFTGEDVAEFHIHGGPAVLEKLSQELLSIHNVRLAEPGEFSLRAYRNGKMDLTELEGLADMIHAETEYQRQQAVKVLNGWNRNIFEDIRNRVIGLLGYVEASIDFVDEELDVDTEKLLRSEAAELKADLKHILDNSLAHETLRDGFRVVLAGNVNVGKSSLLNCLAQRDAAIVSDEGGTTRDVIEVRMDVEGYPILVQDTAGLRATDNQVEIIGIERTKTAAAKADLVICIHDRVNGAYQDPDLGIDPQKMIHVRNKSDLEPDCRSSSDLLSVSARTGQGIDELMQHIGARAKCGFGVKESSIIMRLRHKEHIIQSIQALERVEKHNGEYIELISEDIRLAASQIGAITGRVDVEEMLDRVFSDFCIGK